MTTSLRSNKSLFFILKINLVCGNTWFILSLNHVMKDSVIPVVMMAWGSKRAVVSSWWASPFSVQTNSQIVLTCKYM